jgi:thiamine kinase-like enzyme
MKNLVHKLAKLECFDNIKQICAIKSGLSAHSFKVQTLQGLYFAKYIGENYSSQVEVQCNLIAANNGLSAKVIYTNNEWLVCDYIQGCELESSSLCLESKLRIALSLMVKFHQQEIDLPPLNIYQTIIDLLNPLYYQPKQIVQLTKIAKNISSSIDVQSNYACHGDVNFSNVLLSNNANIINIDNYNTAGYLVDFECACKADVEFDLAMLLAINNPDKAYHRAVFHIYEEYAREHNNVKINPNLVMRYLGFSYLINALWFYNEFKKNKDETSFKRAHKQFILFDSLAIFNDKLSEQMR